MPKTMSVKQAIFLEIFEYIMSWSETHKKQFFENCPRDLQKSPKLNFSQQIQKDKNLRIPKHIDFLKICRFLAIWWLKVFGQI